MNILQLNLLIRYRLVPDEIPKERTNWTDLVCDDYKTDSEAIDLLDKMLMLDQNKRITAEEALNHNFFMDLKIE